ncbi:PQQ-binding-like beta-propeller repeat protein, partial [bacterium]|nr:PQQ-binding-like beta-propeller repeat protein [bacterium]
MRITTRPATTLCFLIALLCATPTARAEDDFAPRIEWADTWRKTYSTNRERWQKELEKAERDEGARRLLVRTAVLCEAEAKRTTEGELVVKHYAETMVQLLRADGSPLVRQLLERLATQLPQRHDLMVAACSGVLRALKWPGEDRHVTPTEPDLGEYAAKRIVALHQAGHLPADAKPLTDAWQGLAIQARREGRLLDAADLLARIGAQTDRGTWWQHEQALLDLAAGRGVEARAAFERLAEEAKDHRAREQLARLKGVGVARPASFLSRFELRNRWERLRDRPLAESATALARLIADAADGESLLPWGESRHASVWSVIDRHLRARPRADLAPLQDAMARDAADALRAARRAGRPDALLALFRKVPWAPAAHAALLEHGEAALRLGRAGAALRSFHDLLAHTADPTLRRQAQAGLSLALGQRSPPVAAPATPPAPLATLHRRVVRAPVLWPWPLEVADALPSQLLSLVPPTEPGLALSDRMLVAAAPQALAAFAPDGKALWTRTPSLLPGGSRHVDTGDSRVFTIPAPVRAAADAHRVYARWGLDRAGLHPTTVAAFDRRTGTLVWSASGEPQWTAHLPVCDPVVAEGRVYVLASRSGVSSVLPVAPVTLACFDAEHGTLLWLRLLGRQSIYLATHGQMGLGRSDSIDVFHYGNAVAVHDGWVYCLTNAGFAARVDARDGLVDWAAPYSRAHLGSALGRALARQGAAPIVAKGVVACVARDRFGAFALAAATGEPVWDSPYAPSNRVLGATADTLVVADRHTAAALDLATGRVRWTRRFDDGILDLATPPHTLATPTALLRLDPASGKTTETLPWTGEGPLPTAADGTTLAALAPRPADR